MVKAVTTFGRSGLSEWLVQRVSGVIILAYIITLLALIGCEPVTYAVWKDIFTHTTMRVFSTMTLFAVVAHAWIGGWSVLTDYVTPRFFKLELGIELGEKANVLRLVLTIAMVLLLIVYTLWGIQVLWGR